MILGDKECKKNIHFASFLKHLNDGFVPNAQRSTAYNDLQILLCHPQGNLAFEVAHRDQLIFTPIHETDVQEFSVVFGHNLIDRFLRKNEFLSPRDFDVRRDSWVNEINPFAWALFNAAFRPTPWARNRLIKNHIKLENQLSYEVETLCNPTILQVLEKISSNTPCKLRYHPDFKCQSLEDLKKDTATLIEICHVKEQRDRQNHLNWTPPPDAPPKAAYRLQHSEKLWSDFSIPFYDWSSFACLEICRAARDSDQYDLYPVQSALSEFRMGIFGVSQISLIHTSNSAGLHPFNSYGSQQFCSSQEADTVTTTLFEPGEILLLTPGWFVQTRAQTDQSNWVSHYWRY